MLLVIINPIAGHGRTLALEEDILKELKARGLSARAIHTKRVGHATELARAARAEGMDGIVCVGGDGTLFEVVNGILGSGMAVYLVPCGTGNDFVRSLPLSRDPLTALAQQLSGKRTTIDLGRINQGAFVNVSGAGFDVEVLRQTIQFKAHGSGLMPYLLGVCAAIRHFKPIDAVLTLDGQVIRNRFTIVSVANGQYFGGGMRVAPGANPSDGYFDVIMVQAIPRWAISFLLPLFIPGWYVHLPVTKVVRCREVIIESDGMTINMDGELRDMNRAAYALLPGGLTISLP